jgi:small GTP-binding protein
LSFLRRLFKQKSKRVVITICGLDKAGKTTIVRYLVAGEYKATTPTMGVNREVIDLPNLQMDIFDLGGQEDFRGLWPEINEKSDGLVYVVDSTDHFRLGQSKEIFYNIIDAQINRIIPVLILLNKCDLENKISRPEFINEFGLMYRENLKWACYVTSAITGEGIYEAFKWFIDEFQD